MNLIARAQIKWDDGIITFEGSEEFVKTEVLKYTQTRKSSEENLISEQYSRQSPAEFVAEKRPKGHHEMVAVLAFLLAEQGKAEFTEDDMRRLYLQARVRPPKVIGQALRDAKNKFDLIDNGEKRGVYKLSHHGDRTVRYDLPRPGL